MTVLVDSGILIEVSRGRNAEIISKWLESSNSGAAVLYSPVSVAELWAGARPNEFDAMNNLFRAPTCVRLTLTPDFRRAPICDSTERAMASKSPTR